MSSEPSLRIAVASADLLARAGLAALFEASGEILVEARLDPRAEGSFEALLGPGLDALLLDAGSDAPADLDLIEDLVEAESPLGLVVLVADAESAALARRAGAQAVLSRERPTAAIAAAIRAACQGLRVDDGDLDAMPSPDRLDSSPLFGSAEPLTPREREVLQLVAEGLTNAAIAARLGISQNTVKFHLNAILTKLDAGSRTEAVVRAAQLGWILL